MCDQGNHTFTPITWWMKGRSLLLLPRHLVFKHCDLFWYLGGNQKQTNQSGFVGNTYSPTFHFEGAPKKPEPFQEEPFCPHNRPGCLGALFSTLLKPTTQSFHLRFRKWASFTAGPETPGINSTYLHGESFVGIALGKAVFSRHSSTSQARKRPIACLSGFCLSDVFAFFRNGATATQRS